MTLKEIYEEVAKKGKEHYTIAHWMDNSEGMYNVTDYEFNDETEEIYLY